MISESPPVNTILFFGERWDSPYLDPDVDRCVIQNPTPVNTPCFWCTELIKPGDRGLFRAVMRGVPGSMTGSVEPIHMECDLRQVMGSPRHLRGECSCAGHETNSPEVSLHEESLESLRIVNEMRAAQGLDPL